VARTAAAVVVLGTATLLGVAGAIRPGWLLALAAAISFVGLLLALLVEARTAVVLLIPLVALGGVAVAFVWPTATILGAALIVVAALLRRAPVHALLTALLLSAFEGALKLRLAIEGAPSPRTIGALAIDLSLFSAIAGLVIRDRATTLRTLWGQLNRFERVALGLLVGWLAVSVLQTAQSGDVVAGVQGFRLSQAYAVAALAGLLIFRSGLSEERVTRLLLYVLAAVSAYAALRTITGPTGSEVTFIDERSGQGALGTAGRALGGFSSPFGVASFLVPASVFGLVLAYLRERDRLLSAFAAVTAAVGVVGSYVRTGLVALAAGAAFLAAMLARGRGLTRRQRLVPVALIVVLLAGGYAGSVLTSDVSDLAKQRSEGLKDPLGDESLNTRLDTWGDTLERVADEPLGSGLGTIGHATFTGERDSDVFTDNSYLKVIREQGVIVGPLFVLGLLGFTGAIAVRLSRAGPTRHPVGVAALAGFVSFMVLAVMAEYFEQPGKVLAWMLLGIAAWEAFLKVSPGENAA